MHYLEGSCTREQLRQIREYLHDEAYRDSLNRFMQEEWETLNRSELPPLAGIEDQYARFRSIYMTPARRTPAARIIRMVAVAAAIFFIIAGIWLLLPRLTNRQDHDAIPQWLSYHSEPGHHKEIALPDSSRIYLGSGSTLRYRQEGNGSRLVRLEGEAYFIVKHDQQRPFAVETGALTTMDIGTEFNIRYYPGEPVVDVAVASGKVQVRQTGRHDAAPLAALIPGQLLHYDSLTQQSGITILPDVVQIGAWRKGILSFHSQRLKDVITELEHYYGTRIQYIDTAADNIRITTLLDNKSLADALEIVSLTAGVHLTVIQTHK